MLNLESLRVFVMAAETENLTRVARQLNMSQPSVSQHVQSLERHLGIELFVRHGRRIKLSPVGQTLLPLSKDLLRSSKQLEEAALALTGEVSGHLTIGCSTSSGKYVLPHLLARYREEFPLVRGTVKVGHRSRVIEWLLAGEVDLAVTSERVNRGGLHHRLFFEDEIVLVVPGNHEWADRESINPNELYHERFILREPDSGTHSALVEGLDQAGIDIERMECVLVLDNSEAIIMTVEEGFGLGFVSKVTAERGVAWGSIKALALKGISMKRWLHMVDNDRTPHSPALNAFTMFVDGLEGAASSVRTGRLTVLPDPPPSHTVVAPACTD
ncbi:MAG: LysR substrate-binding domain-containing protein [Chloroflexota bacterium]|nr:LysR substrate-binding domain-containing protein [Chloroflexota bacterium]